MANRKKSARTGSHKNEMIRFLKFGIIPLMVVVLIIFIMIVDQQEEDQETGPSSASASLSEGEVSGNDSDEGQEGGGLTETGDSRQEQQAEDVPDDFMESEEASWEPADPSELPLLQDSMLELTGLVRLYCEAKTECDPELLAQVFGIEDWTEEEKEEERANMELVKASIKSYENISCYSVQGLEANSYVIFPYYEIRYRETETLMPAISWAYVKRNESGQYYMVQSTDADVNEYIRKVGEKPEVKAVLGQVQIRQQEAVDQDEVLRKIYGGSEGSEVIVGGP